MNQKTAIRLILVLIFSLISLIEISEIYDLLSGFIVLILLIFDLFERNHINDSKTELIYYLSWITIGLITFNIRGSYVRPFNPIFIVLIIKLSTFIIYLFKYKSIQVSRTLLSKVSLILLALYIIELLINSTHGFASTVVFWTKISSIELIILLFMKRKRVDYKISILEFLWK